MAKRELSWCLFVSQVALWLVTIEFMFPCTHSEIPATPKTLCIETERLAILTFQAGLVDPRNILSSWNGEECCKWWGVFCNNETGHITKLNLRSTTADNYNGSRWGDLSGQISPSLLHLKQLRRLDLSSNNFTGTPIPEFIGSLQNLKYLNLSAAGFIGRVPPQLGNLSRLRYLDLSDPNIEWPPYLHVDDLAWLQQLKSLKHLDLTMVSLTAAVDWFQMVNMLPSLTFLRLEFCRLFFIPSIIPYNNLTNLNYLNLAENDFNTSLPHWFWNLSSLTVLKLCSTGFYGPVPDGIGNLVSLERLQLMENNFVGMLPSTFRNLCRLKILDLSYNEFSGEINEFLERLPNCTEQRLQKLVLTLNMLSGRLMRGLERLKSLNTLYLVGNRLDGPIPEEIGKLSQLTLLDLSANNFSGVVTEAHFANMTRLKYLVLSNPLITVSFNQSWIPPFQLKAVGMSYCKVGPFFPGWLQHQKEIAAIDLSYSGIMGTIPEWFFNNFPTFIFLNLGHNHITGKLPAALRLAPYCELVLSSNLFEGPVPSNLPYNCDLVDLSNNSFSGPLPSTESPYLSILDLSNNLFNSVIPTSMGKAPRLMYLDLANNNLSGELPDEWPTESLSNINLGNNYLSGPVPNSISSLTSLRSLGLSNNSLSGLFPASLQPCIRLQYLDLSRNNFVGKIPAWVGESIPFLYTLLLRSNTFSGSIPQNLVQLHYLHILDLADNNLSGPLPQGLGNFSAMTSPFERRLGPDVFTTSMLPTFVMFYYISSFVFTKGEELEYTKNRYLVKSIDLSSNHLSGEIPEEIESLVGLTSLDLSANHLEGKIPGNIGRLQKLESLDLSRNQLSGSIPLSMASMTSLSYLNLSHNRLSGRIPPGNQLQTLLDPSIYAGNADLCGPPLTKNCSSNKTDEHNNEGFDDGGHDEMVWLYLGMAPGYVAGFWAVCGVLLFKKTWRYAYFRFLDNMYDRLYAAVFPGLEKMRNLRMGNN